MACRRRNISLGLGIVAERFGFQPGRLILQALSPAATLVRQVSLIRCAALSFVFVLSSCFFFFPPLLPSRRHVSVSSKRSFDRSKIHTYVHIYVCTHLFPSFSLERRYSRFSISYRRENGIVIHRLEYHADDNYSRIQWWLQPRKRHIFGEIGRDYSRISQYFQDTRIFG